MKKRIKVVSLIMAAVLVALIATGCTEYSKDIQATRKVSNRLQGQQPTPTDIEFSLQRFNLIRRAYWINGMREKARNLPCEAEREKGYIYFFVEGIGCVASYTVDGQITALTTYLTPDSSAYAVSSGSASWLADVDGTYGENNEGIFFFTAEGTYVEWNGLYIYSQTELPITPIN